MSPYRLAPLKHRPVMVAAGLMALGLAAYLFCLQASREQQTQLARAEKALQQTRAMLDGARDQAVLSRRVETALATLRITSLDQVAAQWRDATLRLQSDRRVDAVQWRETAPTVKPPKHAGLPTIRVRHLSLDARLVHAAALIDALHTLSSPGSARVMGLGCDIERNPRFAPESGQLQAHCEFEVFGLHPTPPPAS